MSTQQVAALVLGALAALVLGGIVYSLVAWSRRRRGMRAAAAAAGFSMEDDPEAVVGAGASAFREFRAASLDAAGKGRFENVLRRPRGAGTLFVFDYAAGSAAGDALLPQGTYAWLTGTDFPTFRITPRPALATWKVPGVEEDTLQPVDLDRSTPAAAAFAALYELEAEAVEAARRFLSRDKLEFLAEARPPWLVETGRNGMVLAQRPGSRAVRRFHELPPDELPAFAEAVERAYTVLASTSGGP